MESKSENEFENYLRDLIQTRICENHPELVLFDNKKAVDILICRNGESPALFFLEVKYHKKSHGLTGSPIKGPVKRKNTSPFKKVHLFHLTSHFRASTASFLLPVPHPLLLSFWFSVSRC